jgi:CHAT domain-containing protein
MQLTHAHVLAFDPAFSEPTSQSPGRLSDLLEKGRDAVLTGRPNDALAIYKEAVSLAEANGDEPSLARALEGYGWGEWATGRYPDALATRTRALELFTKLDDPAGQVMVRRGLGETYYSLGKYNEALQQYRLGLEAEARAPNTFERGLILANTGSAYRSLGRFEEARRVLEDADTLIRPTGNHRALSQVLTFLGIVSRATGDYGNALEYYAEAIVERRTAGDRRGESQVLGNLANVHLDVGEFERAIELNDQSRQIAEEIGYRAQVGFAHSNKGAAQSSLGLAKEALQSYERALAVWREIGRRAQIGWTLHNVGILRIYQTGERERARHELDESLHIAREIHDPELEGYAMRGLANLDVLGKHVAKALERFEVALVLARKARPQLEYLLLMDRAEALRSVGRREDAIADLRAAVAIISDLRANVTSDQAKIAFMDSVQTAFHSLADLLFDAGQLEESLEVAEASRSRAFADLLLQREVHGRASVPASVAALRTAIVQSTDASRTDDPVRAALERVRADRPLLASAVTAESPRVHEMRRVAARLDATIVEYLVTERRATAWVVQPSGAIRGSVLPGSPRELLKLSDVRTQIEGTYRLADTDATHRALKELHRSLVAPLSKWLPASPRRRVIIVPHGPLALVPFAALEDSRGTPLIERHTLLYVPSLSVSSFLARSNEDSGAEALIVADPPAPAALKLPRLTASVQEGRRIAAHLKTLKPRLLTGEAATESAVKKGSRSARLLHFATHGLVSETAPLTSSLVLAPGDGEDGLLRVDEVLWMDLNADLVVLSGCSTGAGKSSGDGILGLSRAFLFAGTPSLVVTQWDIADEPTMLLMDRFYAELENGLDKAQALRRAQLATRARYPHPAYWASFVLIGEP